MGLVCLTSASKKPEFCVAEPLNLKRKTLVSNPRLIGAAVD